jgi:sugar lactone lactonase YvrE
VAGGADFYPDEGVAPGFIAALSPDGVVRQVADEIAFSNGMAITEDNSTLIIAESLRKLTRLAQPRLRTVGMRSPAAKTHAD